MTNAGTIPEAVLSACVLAAEPGCQRRRAAAVRPTLLLRLRWGTGEDFARRVLSCGRLLASGPAQGAGFAR
jgi:hypothetical protein